MYTLYVKLNFNGLVSDILSLLVLVWLGNVHPPAIPSFPHAPPGTAKTTSRAPKIIPSTPQGPPILVPTRAHSPPKPEHSDKSIESTDL